MWKHPIDQSYVSSPFWIEKHLFAGGPICWPGRRLQIHVPWTMLDWTHVHQRRHTLILLPPLLETGFDPGVSTQAITSTTTSAETVCLKLHTSFMWNVICLKTLMISILLMYQNGFTISNVILFTQNYQLKHWESC